MLRFFPNPYPDELLYSILARYHLRSGNNSPKITLKELFNDSNTIATKSIPKQQKPFLENNVLPFMLGYIGMIKIG
ncbi:TniQ family protein [Gloeothece citriformis]|uniref:TniQ family protein n=1 Tax=Gloeothece citriformis TaxID=2546356 RepID=UPI00031612BE